MQPSQVEPTCSSHCSQQRLCGLGILQICILHFHTWSGYCLRKSHTSIDCTPVNLSLIQLNQQKPCAIVLLYIHSLPVFLLVNLEGHHAPQACITGLPCSHSRWPCLPFQIGIFYFLNTRKVFVKTFELHRTSFCEVLGIIKPFIPTFNNVVLNSDMIQNVQLHRNVAPDVTDAPAWSI